MKKLVIFGVGLIGGSVALALKKANFATHIVGVGRSDKSLKQALDLGVIDSFIDVLETNIHAASSLTKIIVDTDLILIAAPVAQTKSILQSIKPHYSRKR